VPSHFKRSLPYSLSTSQKEIKESKLRPKYLTSIYSTFGDTGTFELVAAQQELSFFAKGGTLQYLLKHSFSY
jgi:hypothetical protein